jgi:ATP-dependent Clp protease ATP-binding subunit ClpB
VEALLRDRKLRLALSETAKQQLVELGYEPALGARPLRRALIRHIQDPLAERLLEGSIADGGTIRVEWADDAFRFS